jgi:hypothetical protein
MTIRAGKIASHAPGPAWGAGNVLEMTARMATIQYIDGKNRKIVVSSFSTLKPATSAFHSPPTEPVPLLKKASLKTTRKIDSTAGAGLQSLTGGFN